MKSLAAVLLFCATAFAQMPSDAEIRRILMERVGSETAGFGIVVGVIDGTGRRVVAYGSSARNDSRRLDGRTVFEIGSMTKVFTSLLLMDMVRRGEVALTDPVEKFLPATVKVPERNGRKITLADLAMQHSGLPRMPPNFHPKDPANPYADYSRSVTFKGVGAGGRDIYEAEFEKDRMEFRIALTPAGKTAGMNPSAI